MRMMATFSLRLAAEELSEGVAAAAGLGAGVAGGVVLDGGSAAKTLTARKVAKRGRKHQFIRVVAGA